MNKETVVTAAYTIVSITLVVWMVTVGILVWKIAANTQYLALSSDYQIQLLDEIAGYSEPLSQLNGLGYNRSFSCSIDSSRYLAISFDN